MIKKDGMIDKIYLCSKKVLDYLCMSEIFSTFAAQMVCPDIRHLDK